MCPMNPPPFPLSSVTITSSPSCSFCSSFSPVLHIFFAFSSLLLLFLPTGVCLPLFLIFPVGPMMFQVELVGMGAQFQGHREGMAVQKGDHQKKKKRSVLPPPGRACLAAASKPHPCFPPEQKTILNKNSLRIQAFRFMATIQVVDCIMC